MVAFRFLGYSARSRTEMERRLQKGEFDDQIIATVLEELAQRGMINDDKFAADWVDDRAERKHYGKTRLAQELSRKGIDRETIKQTVGEISEEDEFRRALEIVEARWPTSEPSSCSSTTENLDRNEREKEKMRISGFLQRRGFGWSIVKQVLIYRSENRL